MAIAHALALQAASFTLGLAVIHALRRHARLVGDVLIVTALLCGLLLVAGFVAVQTERAAEQGQTLFDGETATPEP